jgi:hypothetical protein
MFNSICERRMQSLGMYAVIMQIPEAEYFEVYDTLSDAVAEDIVVNYLRYHGDDGRPSDIKIRHDPTNHVVTINLFIHYTENDHTEIFRTPNLLNLSRNGSE